MFFDLYFGGFHMSSCHIPNLYSVLVLGNQSDSCVSSHVPEPNGNNFKIVHYLLQSLQSQTVIKIYYPLILTYLVIKSRQTVMNIMSIQEIISLHINQVLQICQLRPKNIFLIRNCQTAIIQFYFMNSRSRSANIPKSLFEKTFQKEQTLKRNKRYIDIPKFQVQEKEKEIYRRMPDCQQDAKTNGKIHQSFMSSTAELTERLEKEIFKYRSRLSYSEMAQESPRSITTASEPSPTSPRKIRCVSMMKMTSREYYHNLSKKPEKDERLFNNFEKFSPSEPLGCSFQKMRGHNLDNTHKHLNDLYHDVQKSYEEFFYKKTTNYCRVNLNAERKIKSERYFFKRPRSQGRAATDLEPEDVDRGAKLATNFKGSNISTGNIDDFYRNSGRNIAPQLEMRKMTSLSNHWKNNSQQIEFDIKKAKEDMKKERIRKIMDSKKSKLDKSNVCDEKYFRRLKKLINNEQR